MFPTRRLDVPVHKFVLFKVFGNFFTHFPLTISICRFCKDKPSSDKKCRCQDDEQESRLIEKLICIVVLLLLFFFNFFLDSLLVGIGLLRGFFFSELEFVRLVKSLILHLCVTRILEICFK